MASTCSSSKLSSGLNSFWWGERRDAGQYAHIQITVIKRMTIMNHPSHTGLFLKKASSPSNHFLSYTLQSLSLSPSTPSRLISFLPLPPFTLLLSPPSSSPLPPSPSFLFLSLSLLPPPFPSLLLLSLSFFLSLSHSHF